MAAFWRMNLLHFVYWLVLAVLPLTQLVRLLGLTVMPLYRMFSDIMRSYQLVLPASLLVLFSEEQLHVPHIQYLHYSCNKYTS